MKYLTKVFFISLFFANLGFSSSSKADNLQDQTVRSIVAPFIKDIHKKTLHAASKAGLRLSLNDRNELVSKVSYRIEFDDQKIPVNRVEELGLDPGTYKLIVFEDGRESFQGKFIALPDLVSDLHLDYTKNFGFTLQQSINLPLVHFVIAKKTIKKESLPILDDLSDILLEQKSIRKLSIRVHTDSGGLDWQNFQLTQARADQIKAYLIDHGIEDSRIQARGIGSSQLLVKESSYEDRVKNRRVEYIISSNSEKPMTDSHH